MKLRALLVTALLLPACSASTEMNVEVISQVTSDSALYTQTQAYLNAHHLFDFVKATLDCPDGSDACLLRLEANNQVTTGEAASLILYVATGVQPLPGSVDLSGAYQYGVDPVSYAAIEEAGLDDLSRRYDYTCQFRSGNLTLEEAPVIGEALDGQFDLEVDCIEQLAPTLTLPAELKGTFSTEVEAPPY